MDGLQGWGGGTIGRKGGEVGGDQEGGVLQAGERGNDWPQEGRGGMIGRKDEEVEGVAARVRRWEEWPQE